MRAEIALPAHSANTLTRAWAGALRPLVIRHPNPNAVARLTLLDGNPPSLSIALSGAIDSTTEVMPMRDPFEIATVRLACWPGTVVARRWIAAAWAGYLQHEALELVTVDGLIARPLDPHEAPFCFDRGLRAGMPPELTPSTMRDSLAVVMDRGVVDDVMAEATWRL